MTTLHEAGQRIGQHIKSDHPYTFRSGEWATIVDAQELPDRVLWWVRFPDGATDEWVVDDPSADYKFRDAFAAVDTAVRALETLQRVTIAVLKDSMFSGIRAPRELRDELTDILRDHADRVPR